MKRMLSPTQGSSDMLNFSSRVCRGLTFGIFQRASIPNLVLKFLKLSEQPEA